MSKHLPLVLDLVVVDEVDTVVECRGVVGSRTSCGEVVLGFYGHLKMNVKSRCKI